MINKHGLQNFHARSKKKKEKEKHAVVTGLWQDGFCKVNYDQ